MGKNIALIVMHSELLNIQGISSVMESSFSWVDYEITIENGTNWNATKQIEDMDFEIVEFGPDNTLLLKDD